MDAKSAPREALDLDTAFARIDEHWRPRVAAALNGEEFKLVKFQGQFVWHAPADSDELFLVRRGRMRLEFRDHVLEIGPGQMAVVPRGVEHRTSADQEVLAVIVEAADVRNTGDVVDARLTAPRSTL